MESQRLILFFVFAFSVFLLLDGWQREQQAARVPAVAEKGDKASSSTTPTPTPGEKLAATQAVSVKCCSSHGRARDNSGDRLGRRT
jgi:YidC/Oxa1 family membrane protein insertase